MTDLAPCPISVGASMPCGLDVASFSLSSVSDSLTQKMMKASNRKYGKRRSGRSANGQSPTFYEQTKTAAKAKWNALPWRVQLVCLCSTSTLERSNFSREEGAIRNGKSFETDREFAFLLVDLDKVRISLNLSGRPKSRGSVYLGAIGRRGRQVSPTFRRSASVICLSASHW